MNAKFEVILEKIKEYDNIVIFGHEVPDYDCLGSQFGLKYFLVKKFPKKNIYVVGSNHDAFTPKLFPYIDVLPTSWFTANTFLAIFVDLSNIERASDKRYNHAKEIIKIDHHPKVESFGKLEYIEEARSSCAEILAEMMLVWDKSCLDKDASKYLYIGMVGDSNRFMYEGTNSRSFVIASNLVDKGFDLSKDVYLPMYERKSSDIQIISYIFNNYKLSPNGVAYYHFDDETLKKFNMQSYDPKNFINQLANFDGIDIWVSFSQDIANNTWRVSIRSKLVSVSEVASHFNGGGHAHASGGKCASYEATLDLINQLDDLLKRRNK
jgi:phosphoesterase RecJ-like protein